jgi:hypothetical protein
LCKNRRQNNIYPLEILDITNPEIPIRIGTLKSPVVNNKKWFEYVHDVHVNNDTAFCSCGNNGLYIFDCSNPSSPKYISSFTQYPLSGYNHSGCLNAADNMFYFTDENNGSGIKIVDFNNLKQPNLLSIIQPASNAIPHNTYIKQNRLYASCYHEGVKIYDIQNAQSTSEIGWFDTYTQNAPNDYQGFKGCWSVYPWLPSGIILASDTHNGLFVLETDSNLAIEKIEDIATFTIYPNPANQQISIYTNNKETKNISIYSNNGVLVKSALNPTNINIENMLPGIYMIKVDFDKKSSFRKLIKY